MTTKATAMREWTPEECAAKEREWTQALFTLRLQKSTGQLENPMKIAEVRRDIARLKTVARQAAPKTATTATTAKKA